MTHQERRARTQDPTIFLSSANRECLEKVIRAANALLDGKRTSEMSAKELKLAIAMLASGWCYGSASGVGISDVYVAKDVKVVRAFLETSAEDKKPRAKKK